MRRSEKIERYLREHPREVTVSRLQKKFGLTYQEAKFHHASFFGTNPHRSEQAFGLRFWLRMRRHIETVFSTEKRQCLGLIALALLVRIGYAWSLSFHPELRLPLLDARYYIDWAKRIVETGWLGDKVFFTEPLYAYFLAGFFRWFGNGAQMMALVVQGGLGAVLPIGVYLLSKQFFTTRVSLVAGVLTALYGPFVFYEELFLKTSLEVWALTLFVYLLVWKFSVANRKWVFGLGILLGLTTLIKGNNIIVWPIVVLALFRLRIESTRRERYWLAGMFTLGVWLCIVPVTVRNFVVGHDIVLTNYSAGLALYQGNWYGSDGTTALVPPFLRPDPKYEETDTVKMAEAFEGRELRPSEVSRFWSHKAAQEIVADPGHFVTTIGYKALLLINHGEVSDNYSYDFYRERVPWMWLLPSAWPVLVCGVVGVLFFLFSKQEIYSLIETKKDRILWQQKKQVLLWVLAGYVIVLLFTTINSRYRLPLFPFLILFSSVTLVSLGNSLAERRYGVVRMLVIGIGIMTLLSTLPLRVFTAVGEANALYTVGTGYAAQGDESQATKYFEAAKQADSKYAWAYARLFMDDLKKGDREQALDNLKQLILIRPDDLSHFDKLKLFKDTEQDSPDVVREKIAEYERTESEPVYDPFGYEGARFLARHDTEQAKEQYKQSLDTFGDRPSTLIALASIARDAKNDLMAEQYYRRTLSVNPWILTARYNLANIAIGKNEYPAVVDLLRDVYAVTPELGETWYNYAVALIKTGKNAEAATVAQAYVEHYRDDPSKKDKVDKFEAALKPATPSADNLMKQIQKP